MDSDEKHTGTTPVHRRDRFVRVWLAPLAAVGALAGLVSAGLRIRSTARLAPPPAPAPPLTPGVRRTLPMAQAPAAPPRQYARHYTQTAVLGSAPSPDGFRRRLTGIGVGPGDQICLLGDDEVRIFDSLLRRVRAWRAPENASSVAIGPDGRIYVGSPGRVDVFDGNGQHVGGFASGEKDSPADVTAIKVSGAELLVADANRRLIRRHSLDGTPRGFIGSQGKTGSFMLPNRSLDIAVDAAGVVYATDSGRHNVTMWALDGSPLGKFGKFGMTAPEDFVGCCNPVNITVTPDGKIVTGEKMVARVKVFERDGTLLAVIGPEHFDPSCIHIHLAVDSTGRILAGDPVTRDVRIFSVNQPPRQGEHA